MGREIPLGRLAGIKVTMDLTVPLLAIAFAYFYATSASGFPAVAPDISGHWYWVAGATSAVLFFVSLLVHEMGHALVAQDEGIGVRGISLWLLGGVAKLESSPATPRSEFRIAVVGPLASAACGVVFLVASYTLADDTGLAGLAGAVTFILGSINLLLAAFNLLPATPLDGGTVLSAMIWKRTDRRALGMRWSSYSGVALGSAMVLYGLKPFAGMPFNTIPISLMLVGGFIAYGAWRSLQSLPMFELLGEVTVAEAMAAGPPSAPAWSALADFVSTLPDGNQHQAYPVFDQQGRISGLLTVEAVRAVPSAQWAQVRVSDVAYPIDRVTVVQAGEALLPAVQRIDGGDVREGLVTGPDGSVVGTLSARALFRILEHRRLAAAAPA